MNQLIKLLPFAVVAASTASAVTVINSDVTSDQTWGPNAVGVAADTEYVLDKAIFVENGATLTIEAGVIVRGQPRTLPVAEGSTDGAPGSLIVTQTGMINAVGTETNPIIFTTAAVDDVAPFGEPDVAVNGELVGWTPGATFYDDAPKTAPLSPLDAAGEANIALWGGVVINGNAPTNLTQIDPTLPYGVGLVEGLIVPGTPLAKASYGGVNPHDNSGTLSYVSIRHGGDVIGDANEINGLTLAGVGNGTTINNVEIYCNLDDGIEWFGGTVNTSKLAVFFAGDDQFDIDQGFTGVGQFWFTIMPFFNEDDNEVFGADSGDRMGEWDGDEFDEGNDNGNLVNTRIAHDLTSSDAAKTPWPLSYPVVYNFTGMGNAEESWEATPVSPAVDNEGIRMRNGFAGELWNAVIVNTGSEEGVNVAGGGTPGFTSPDNAANGILVIGASTFADVNLASTTGTDETNAFNNGTGLVTGATPFIDFTLSFVNATAFGSFSLNNEDISFDPKAVATGGKLASTLKSAPIDPKYSGGSAFYGASVFAHGESTPLEVVGYRGAFDTSGVQDLWTTGWTTLNIAGLLVD